MPSELDERTAAAARKVVRHLVDDLARALGKARAMKDGARYVAELEPAHRAACATQSALAGTLARGRREQPCAVQRDAGVRIETIERSEALTVDELAAVVWDAFEVGRRALDIWRARARPAAGG